MAAVFGACSYESRKSVITCKASCLEVVEEKGFTERNSHEISYASVTNFLRYLNIIIFVFEDKRSCVGPREFQY